MSTDPQRGQSLTQHEGSITDAGVPDRAGAIVAEVITSITEETRARADELRATAEEEARAEVASAREASGKIRTSFGDLATKLGDLRSGIAQEEGVLSSSLNRLAAGQDLRAISPPPPMAEGEPGTFAQEAVADAEVVEEHAPEEVVAPEEPPAPDESGAREEAPAPEEAPASEETPVPEEPDSQGDDKIRSELARMSDTELGHTYVDAIQLSHDREQAGMDPSRANAVAHAVVEEARTRQSFAEPETPTRGIRARLASVAGRHVVSPKDRLREAIRRSDT